MAETAETAETAEAARSLELVRLSELDAGHSGRLDAPDVADGERGLLAAMGLTEGSRVVVRQSGDPCIVEVRSTRIGLARRLAHRLRVRREPPDVP
jgi:Fe2+ transport system protein FeoA